MPLTGYTHATSPGQIILGPAILFVGGVPHSASRGVRCEFIDEVTQPQIDGLVAPMAGLDYRAATGVRITGTFLELGAAQVARYQSNTTGVLAGGVTTYTPREPGLYLPSPAGYLADVEVRVVDGAGDTHAVEVPLAHVVTRAMDGADGVSLTLEARSTDPDVVPYVYTISDPTPVLTSIVIAPASVTLDAP